MHLCSVDKYGESTAVHKKVLIVDDFGIAAPKTKEMAGVLKALKLGETLFETV